MVYLGEAETGFEAKLQDTQDKMLRRIGDNEFPSLESENVRVSRSWGISWPHFLGLQMGD